MDKPSGLFMFEGICDSFFEQTIDKWFNEYEVQKLLFPVGNSEKSRKVIHYGYAYNYVNGNIREDAPDFPMIINMMLWSIPKIWVDAPHDVTARLNQCIINRYLPGQGINSHIDRKEYGEVIICFTFGSGREMEFKKKDINPYYLYTPPASMYVMSGPSRHKWSHQMKGRKFDIVEGKKIPRGVTFSITFREVAE